MCSIIISIYICSYFVIIYWQNLLRKGQQFFSGSSDARVLSRHCKDGLQGQKQASQGGSGAAFLWAPPPTPVVSATATVTATSMGPGLTGAQWSPRLCQACIYLQGHQAYCLVFLLLAHLGSCLMYAPSSHWTSLTKHLPISKIKLLEVSRWRQKKSIKSKQI